jgi:hypothetical protein
MGRYLAQQFSIFNAITTDAANRYPILPSPFLVNQLLTLLYSDGPDFKRFNSSISLPMLSKTLYLSNRAESHRQ